MAQRGGGLEGKVDGAARHGGGFAGKGGLKKVAGILWFMDASGTYTLW